MLKTYIFCLLIGISSISGAITCKQAAKQSKSIRLFNPESPDVLIKSLNWSRTFYEAKTREDKLNSIVTKKQSIWEKSYILQTLKWVFTFWKNQSTTVQDLENHFGFFPTDFAKGNIVDLKMSNLTDALLLEIVKKRIRHRLPRKLKSGEVPHSLFLKLDYNPKLTDKGIAKAIRLSVGKDGKGLLFGFSSSHNKNKPAKILQALVETQKNSLVHLSIENIRNRDLTYFTKFPQLKTLTIANTNFRSKYNIFRDEFYIPPFPFVTAKKIARTLEQIFKTTNNEFRTLTVPSLNSREVTYLQEVIEMEKNFRLARYRKAKKEAGISETKLRKLLSAAKGLKIGFADFRLRMEPKLDPRYTPDGDTSRNNFLDLDASKGINKVLRDFGLDAAEISDTGNLAVYALAVAARNMNYYYRYMDAKRSTPTMYLLKDADLVNVKERNGRFIGIVELKDGNGEIQYLPQMIRIEGLAVSRYAHGSNRDGYQIREIPGLKKEHTPDWINIYKANYKTIMKWLDISPYSIMTSKDRDRYYPDGYTNEIDKSTLPKPEDL